MMAVDHGDIISDVELDIDLWWNRGARRVPRQLADVDGSAGAFWKTSELGKAARHLFESLRLDRQHLDRLGELRGCIAAQSRDRESNRRQRVLELVRDLSR